MTPKDIKEFRREWGLSQRDLAALTGTRTGRTVRRWEHGERDIPDSARIIMGLLQTNEELFTVIPQVREEMGIPPVADSWEAKNAEC